MVRNLWTAAEARHGKPQGFIFSPGSSTQGQDREVKLFLFLSDHFHIWTALVPLCVTESLPSVEPSGPCVESTACARTLYWSNITRSSCNKSSEISISVLTYFIVTLHGGENTHYISTSLLCLHLSLESGGKLDTNKVVQSEQYKKVMKNRNNLKLH